MNDYELRHLFGVVDGGINLLRAHVNRLTDAQRQKLAANFVEAAPAAAPSEPAPQPAKAKAAAKGASKSDDPLPTAGGKD